MSERIRIPPPAPAARKAPMREQVKKQTLKRRKKLLKLFESQGGACHICGEQMDLPDFQSNYRRPRDATLDHYVPRSKGGTWALTNLRAAHSRCNLYRGNGPVESVEPVREITYLEETL